MNLMFVIDDNYIEQLIVCLNSIFCSGNKDVNIFLMTPGIEEQNRIKLDTYAGAHGSIITYLHMKEIGIDFSDMVNEVWNPIVFYKLAGFFEIETSKLLYLDSDIIVEGDLRKLYDIDVDGYYAAVARDTGLSQVLPFWHIHKWRLGMENDEDYFNAGVMLLNLDKIRSKYTLSDFVDIYKRYHRLFIFNEQDLLNLAWKGNVCYIDSQYNRLASDFVYRKTAGNNDGTVIWHYTTNKPWKKWDEVDPDGYEWYSAKYIHYAKIPETQNLYKILKRNRRPLHKRIFGEIKRCFGFNSQMFWNQKESMAHFLQAIFFYKETDVRRL